MRHIIRIFTITTIFVVFSLLFVEIIKYPGFLKKHIVFGPFSIMGLCSVLYFVCVDKLSRKNKMFIGYTSLAIFSISLAVYIIASGLNAYYYSNYSFSKYHLATDSLANLFVFSLIILIVSNIFSHKLVKIRKQKTLLLASIFLCIYTISSISQTLNLMVKDTMFILFHSHYSYEMKMQELWGPYYNFIIFVKENTKDNATILIPPQEHPWLFEGNGALDRYFLYPRKLLSAPRIIDSLDVDQVDHIIISKGFSAKTAAEYNLWPKQLIKSKSYSFIDLTSKETTNYQENYYDKDNDINTGWGLINIK